MRYFIFIDFERFWLGMLLLTLLTIIAEHPLASLSPLSVGTDSGSNETVEARLEKANRYLGRYETAEAIALYRATEKMPLTAKQKAASVAGLGMSYFRRGQLQESAVNLQAAVGSYAELQMSHCQNAASILLRAVESGRKSTSVELSGEFNTLRGCRR